MSSDTTWDDAVAASVANLTSQSRRERTRHARNFAAWCAERAIDPRAADARAINEFLASLGGRDCQLRTKARSSLRAVLREIDPVVAGEVTGLGCQIHALEAASPALKQLADEVVQRLPARVRVRRSALGRLFTWAAEVGVDPGSLTVADVPQFQDWLHERGCAANDYLPVAREFIALVESPVGRATFGRPDKKPARPLRLELRSPLAPRFDLQAVTPDRFGRSESRFSLAQDRARPETSA